MTQHRISVIGSGFAALTAVRELRKRDKSVAITVISPHRTFVYLPGLIWIPSGIRHETDLEIPLGRFFEKWNVSHLEAEVSGLRDHGRIVETSVGEVKNDALIIASGGRFLKKLPGIEHVITPCEGMSAAIRIRDRLAAMSGGIIAVGFSANPNEPTSMRGGPMFEFLLGLDTLLRRQGRREQFKLVFFNPAAEPGKRLGAKAVTHLLQSMAKRGIETRLGHKIKGFGPGKVVMDNGEFAADLILFMPGMTGNYWFDNSELPRSDGGLIKADAHCRVAGFSCTYVAGDSGSFPGPEWLPKQAHMADLQAATAAENVLNELRGEAFHCRFKVELMCIIDSLDKGMLVVRTPDKSTVMPLGIAGHWLKRFFEWWYLRHYR